MLELCETAPRSRSGMEVSSVTRARYRITCELCDLVVDVDGPSVIYAVDEARSLDHDHDPAALDVEYATQGGYSRVGGPRRAPRSPAAAVPGDELSEALLALDDEVER